MDKVSLAGDFDPSRQRFVGAVDLPECVYSYNVEFSLEFIPPAEEPLLKESQRRFVLFPIQYPEVCTLLGHNTTRAQFS